MLAFEKTDIRLHGPVDASGCSLAANGLVFTFSPALSCASDDESMCRKLPYLDCSENLVLLSSIKAFLKLVKCHTSTCILPVSASCFRGVQLMGKFVCRWPRHWTGLWHRLQIHPALHAVDERHH